MFEYNDPSIFAARQILGNRAKVIKKDIVEDPFEIENESVDVVLGSGAFTYEVLKDKEAGIKVIKKRWIFSVKRFSTFNFNSSVS